MIIPDSAHGTNPASVTLGGYEVTGAVRRPGLVDVAALRERLDDDVAGIMLTNPNTLGLFEEDIAEIAAAVHEVGGLLYYDGANLNAILGVTRPGDMGFDIVHMNLHKTFAVPHGGGGPGAGPVAVTAALAPYLPGPRPVRRDDGGGYGWEEPEHSIGRVHGWHGNALALARAYSYILANGGDGLRRVADAAVLNANWLRHRLRGVYDIPYDRPNMHEFVASAAGLKKRTGVQALDVAKRLLEEGFHAPTVYFPLIVDEALMIEPTETESPQTLEALAEALIRIAEAAATPGRGGRGPRRPPHHARRPGRRGPRRPPPHPDLGRPAAQPTPGRNPNRASSNTHIAARTATITGRGGTRIRSGRTARSTRATTTTTTPAGLAVTASPEMAGQGGLDARRHPAQGAGHPVIARRGQGSPAPAGRRVSTRPAPSITPPAQRRWRACSPVNVTVCTVVEATTGRSSSRRSPTRTLAAERPRGGQGKGAGNVGLPTVVGPVVGRGAMPAGRRWRPGASGWAPPSSTPSSAAPSSSSVHPERGIADALLILGYLGQFAFSIWNLVRQGQTGQTIGKGVLKIRLVRLDGVNPPGVRPEHRPGSSSTSSTPCPATSATCGPSGTRSGRPSPTRSSTRSSSPPESCGRAGVSCRSRPGTSSGRWARPTRRSPPP